MERFSSIGHYDHRWDDALCFLPVHDRIVARASSREWRCICEHALRGVCLIVRQLHGDETTRTTFWFEGPNEDDSTWTSCSTTLVLGVASIDSVQAVNAQRVARWLCPLAARLKLDLQPKGAVELAHWMTLLAPFNPQELRLRCFTCPSQEREQLSDCFWLLGDAFGSALQVIIWAWDYRYRREAPNPNEVVVGPPLPTLDGSLLPLRAALPLCTAATSVERLHLDLGATDFGLPGVDSEHSSQLLLLSSLAVMPQLRHLQICCGEVSALQEQELSFTPTETVASALARVQQLRVLHIDSSLLSMQSEKASKAVARMLSRLTNLMEIRRLDDSTPEFWAEVRKNVPPRLSDLELEYTSDAIEPLTLTAMVDGVCAMPALRTLHVTFMPCWAITPHGGLCNQREIFAGLKASNITQLSISLEDEDSPAFVNWLRSRLGPHIEVIDLPSPLDDLLKRVRQ